MTASESLCRIGFRPMPGQPVEQLLNRLQRAAETNGLEFKIGWNEPAIRTDPKSPFIQDTLQLAGKTQAKAVAYGTDGSSFLDVKQMVVLGPGDIAQAHTDDEWIALDQLHAGVDLYERLIRRWCSQ
jgi:acetylornithine deacetylase